MALNPGQKLVVNDHSRFKCIIAGRRWGKSYLAMRTMASIARYPDKRIYYIAPTYRMAKSIIWDELKYRLMDMNWVSKVNESDLTITLINGSRISLRGADNRDSLRGVGLDYIILDEFAMMAKEVWSEVCRPMLSDRQGGAMLISTPMGTANWSYDVYQEAKTTDDWSAYSFKTIEGGNVTAEEIEAAKRDLDIRQFRQEYEASFEQFANQIYYSFEREHNVIDRGTVPTNILHIGIDFNVSPVSACVGVKLSDTEIHFIDEVRIFGSNTHELAEEIKSRYPNSKIFVYPDPAGAQHRTSAQGKTDLTILEEAGFIVKAPRSHPPVRDRINSVNAKLCSADGIRTLTIDPKCKYLIQGLERQTYKEGSNAIPDKDSGFDHLNDACGYCIHYLWPIRRTQPDYEPQRWGHRTGVLQ